MRRCFGGGAFRLDKRAETGWISSVLTEIESFRALARYAPEAASRLPAVLALIDLDQRIRILARTSSRSQCAAWMPFTSAQPCNPARANLLRDL